MKIFLYGSNCASVMNSLAIGLKGKGHEVKGCSYFDSNYNNYSELRLMPFYEKSGLKKISGKLINNINVIKAILWCDVVHIFWDANPIIIWVCKIFKKKRFVTFVGSEIRRPSVSLDYNPYYKYAYSDPNYEYRTLENDETSIARQKKFADAGFQFIVWDVSQYLDKGICKQIHILPHASVNTLKAIPKTDDEHIRILHAPSAPVAKGSAFIIKTLERLKEKYPFVEIYIVKNVSNEQYQQMVADCDIYVDQLIWGAYGIAAQQALLSGKVVVCYLNDLIQKQAYQAELPIQNATIETLESVLEDLINNKGKRHIISLRSKDYYYRFHAPEQVAYKILKIYTQ